MLARPVVQGFAFQFSPIFGTFGISGNFLIRVISVYQR